MWSVKRLGLLDPDTTPTGNVGVELLGNDFNWVLK